MTMRDDDFDPGLSREDREALRWIAAYLTHERPIPAATFRGELERKLARHHGRRMRTIATRRLAVSTLAAGATLLIVAGLGLGHIGPLAPSAVDAAASWLQGSMG
jgi:hypothetical protein